MSQEDLVILNHGSTSLGLVVRNISCHLSQLFSLESRERGTCGKVTLATWGTQSQCGMMLHVQPQELDQKPWV
jgi:hypothetical protein